MNTIEELTNDYNIDLKTAQRMIKGNQERVGSVNGVMEIADVTYIGDGTKEVELKCTECGKRYKSKIKSGVNKWSELRRTCDCESKEKEEQKERDKIKGLQGEIGKIYGDFIVIDYIHEPKKADRLVGKCTICGAIKHLGITKTNSHCSKHYNQTTKYDENYIGRKNNYLTVKGITHGKDGKKRFVCECECGKITFVKPTFWENGEVKSCGCYQENRSVDADETARIKNIFYGMKSRCYGKSNKSYSRYGGRGIKICDEWLNDINSFITWSLENGYNNRLTIDRIDNDGNYEPSNCRWATYKLQSLNKTQRGKNEDYNRPENE